MQKVETPSRGHGQNTFDHKLDASSPFASDTALFPVPPSRFPLPAPQLPRFHTFRLLETWATKVKTRMLAAPLQSTSAFNDHTDINTQYRPAKDIQAFNALLPPPIEFVKSSSTGNIAPGDGKYQPINVASNVEKANVSPQSGG